MTTGFHLLGSGALLVTLSKEVSEAVNEQVLRICRAVEEAGVPGIGEAQPAYSSLCVYFDPAKVRASYVRELVRSAVERAREDDEDPQAIAGRRLVEIPTVYGGDEGPDLEWSAQHLGISQDELVRRHSSGSYRVYMVGFTPGFPYMGGMDESIALPRLPQPRSKVPPGSVGIGGSQTGVYPWETPGGWRLLGRTGLTLFSPWRDDPSLLHPGDTVKFVPVSRRSGHLQAQASDITRRCEDDSVGALKVEHPGFYSMVVDEGRFGYRKLGVPVSGACDPQSFRLANLLVGNRGGEAALEMTLLGAKVRSLVDCVIAFTGARAPLQVDGREAPMDSPIPVSAGSLLEIGPFTTGCRAYLAIAGGIDVPRVMGSRSTYARGGFGGYLGRALRMGDVLPAGPAPDADAILAISARIRKDGLLPTSVTPRLDPPVLELRVMDGPEAEPRLLDALCSEEYRVRPESDRMGLRLAGPLVPVEKGDILSSPVVPGTIQVPSDGRPLMLLADGQTTGGYNRIAVVLGEDLPLAGQLRPGARVSFRRAT